EILKDDPQRLRVEGEALLAKGQPDDAAAAFDRALIPKPDDAYTLYLKGVALRQRGDPVGALETLRRAVSIEPRLYRAHVELGELLLQQGRSDEALAALDQAFTEDPRLITRVLRARAAAMASLGHYEEALRVYDSLRDHQRRSG